MINSNISSLDGCINIKIHRSEYCISMQSKLTLEFSFQFYADDSMKSKNIFSILLFDIFYLTMYIDNIKIWKRINADRRDLLYLVHAVKCPFKLFHELLTEFFDQSEETLSPLFLFYLLHMEWFIFRIFKSNLCTKNSRLCLMMNW